MRIKELFDSPVEYSPFKKDKLAIYSFFEVANQDYVVFFINLTKEQAQATYEMSLHMEMPKTPYNNKIYGLFFGIIPEGTNYSSFFNDIVIPGKLVDSTTGTGNAPIVFSTVGSIIKDFFEKYAPNVVFYGAKEKNRHSLYRILTKKLLSIFSNYVVNEDWQENYLSFFLSKKR